MSPAGNRGLRSVNVQLAAAEAISLDPWLKPYQGAIEGRLEALNRWLEYLDEHEGGLDKFSRSYQVMGSQIRDDNSICYTEYAPNAKEAYLIGDFNQWHRSSHPMTALPFGKWTITLPPNSDGSLAIPVNSRVKVRFVIKKQDGPDGGQTSIERIPPWIHRAEQNPSTKLYEGIFVDLRHNKPRPPAPKAPPLLS